MLNSVKAIPLVAADVPVRGLYYLGWVSIGLSGRLFALNHRDQDYGCSPS